MRILLFMLVKMQKSTLLMAEYFLFFTRHKLLFFAKFKG